MSASASTRKKIDERYILEIFRYLSDFRQDLTILQKDTKLASQGYEFFYAVDFSVLFAYIYRNFSPNFIVRLPFETEDRHFARFQVALNIVFGKDPQFLLLIPPYAL